MESYGELKTMCSQLRDELAAERAKLLRVVYERDTATAELERVKAELDAAVRDMKEYGVGYGFTCEVCAHMRGTEGNPCFYPAGVDVSDEMCEACNKCPCCHCDGVSQWTWRGLRKEAT